MLTIDIVSAKKGIKTERKIITISTGWAYVYIPMSEKEEELCGKDVKSPCWRIGVQIKDNSKYLND